MRIPWILALCAAIFLLLLNAVHSLQIDDSKSRVLGKPYLDKSGHMMCQDTEETVEDMEFDKEIICRVMLEENCPDEEEEEVDEVCHMMYKKECKISYRPHMTKVKVKVCPNGDVVDLEEDQSSASVNSVVMDIRPAPKAKMSMAKCVNGHRIVCETKYETECHTEYLKHEMEEDRPMCRVQLVDKARFDKESGKMEMEKVPAMRCKIQKTMVTKTQPETKCERIPRQMCRKESCSQHQSSTCYYRTKIVNEVIPDEKCELRPHKMCQEVRRARQKSTSTSSRNCQRRPVKKCQMVRVNPKPVLRKVTKKVCKDLTTISPPRRQLP